MISWKDIVVKDDDFVNNSTVMDGLADGTIMGKDDKPYTKYNTWWTESITNVYSRC